MVAGRVRVRYRRALRALLALALLLAVAASSGGCSRAQFEGALSGVIQPRIVPSATEQGWKAVAHEFDFEDARVRIEVPVDQAVYAGAVGAEKSATFVGRPKPPDWIADYYRAFIEEEHQAEFYDSMAEALNQVREQRGLDDSRYLELVTSMAQELEYRTDPGDLAPKFPIETFGDGYGDCDDKVLLAAALLSREGYDVAVLVFSPEKHVALGVRAPGLDYKGTGYAYVELTDPSFVGVPIDELSGGVELTSQPEVVKIGEGERTFGAGEQILYIQQRLRDIEAAEKELRAQIERATQELRRREASLEAAKQELQTLRDPIALKTAIERYNADVNTYNELATQVNELVSRHNALADAERYAAEHETARPQSYERLRSVEL